MEKQKRVTLRDIAKKTGFTVNTVSRALKDRDDISDATKKVIRNAARELHYIGDVAASALRSGTTKTIAVIVGDIANPFFGTLVRGIEMVAKQYDYSIIIFNTSENSKWEQHAILSAYSKRVDGILICPVQENTENLQLLQDIAIPFVLMGRHFREASANAVVWDDRKGGELATSYLIEMGHVNILYLGGPLHISSGTERLQGYRDAYQKAGLPVREKLIRISDITAGASGQMMLELLKEKLAFTAMVVFSDLMAYEVMRTMNASPGPHPVQRAIVGFDNVQGKLMLPMNLPSVDCKGNMPRTIVEFLLKDILPEHTSKSKVIQMDVQLKLPEA